MLFFTKKQNRISDIQDVFYSLKVCKFFLYNKIRKKIDK